ncbi:MAG: argininosuccinate lyase [Verrucomicrobiota bacterium]
MKTKNKNPWGGRFDAAPAELLQQLSCSVHFDRRLYAQDIRGSVAHARMLKSIGVLSASELKAIEDGLKQIQALIESGKFRWKDELEDVHMNIEAALTKITPAGAKLHTGRSRNDQVATDMRLWMKDEIDALVQLIGALQTALISFAEREREILIPGYTHLQRAQPVYLAHHLLAYVEMLERDKGRMLDARQRADVLPLGSGALAGSTLPLDRDFVAKELDFKKVSSNSLDAVSDRDFIAEFLFAGALLGVHLSRLAEDFILWASAEFRFVEIGDQYTTGSSLMPQKKNPDVAELVRGKSGRLNANLVSLLTLLKGLPMTYNRDLQEDKEPMFDTADTLRISLQVFAGMVQETRAIAESCQKAVSDPLLMATDIADRLVEEGIPFRQAHEIVGKGVALAQKRQIPLSDLKLADWQEINPQVTVECLNVFQPEEALKLRKMKGAPNLKLIQKEVSRWKRVLKSD